MRPQATSNLDYKKNTHKMMLLLHVSNAAEGAVAIHSIAQQMTWMTICLFLYDPKVKYQDEYESQRQEIISLISSLSSTLNTQIGYRAPEPKHIPKLINSSNKHYQGCAKCVYEQLLTVATFAKNQRFDAFTSSLVLNTNINQDEFHQLAEKAAQAVDIIYHRFNFDPRGLTISQKHQPLKYCYSCPNLIYHTHINGHPYSRIELFKGLYDALYLAFMKHKQEQTELYCTSLKKLPKGQFAQSKNAPLDKGSASVLTNLATLLNLTHEQADVIATELLLELNEATTTNNLSKVQNSQDNLDNNLIFNLKTILPIINNRLNYYNKFCGMAYALLTAQPKYEIKASQVIATTDKVLSPDSKAMAVPASQAIVNSTKRDDMASSQDSNAMAVPASQAIVDSTKRDDMASSQEAINLRAPAPQKNNSIRYKSLYMYFVDKPHTISNDDALDIMALRNNVQQKSHNCYAVTPNLSNLLSSFLLTTKHHKQSVLLLGPYCHHIIASYSYGTYSQGFYELLFKNDFNNTEFTKALEIATPCLAIGNLPDSIFNFKALKSAQKYNQGQVFWQYPYYEDFIIHPQKIFDYAYPVISELFISAQPDAKIPYNSTLSTIDINIPTNTSLELEPITTQVLQNLELRPQTLQTLRSLVLDTYSIYLYFAKHSQLPHLDEGLLKTTIEVLFGVTPFALCLDRIELIHPYLNSPQVLDEVKSSLRLLGAN